ncbi:6-phospho-beta-glucosidase [Beutenbergia cavernae]|uniref:family 4 glycosyl hydrolase n=1 Tax=Beutenbergia cavernae TaxID=84757 RepID=UPI0005B84A74|nr:6-phospho-beta-glucosidase [Beutenbergia cavernae]
MRLTIVGGGGFRVPLVVRAVAAARDRTGIDEIVLTDPDADRLRAVEAVLAADAEGWGSGGGPRVVATPDLDVALSGAAVVFSAIRVGGTAGRIVDERVPLALGLLGQETIGAGGIAYALRTVGVVDDLAARIARHAPDAWTINFTNPAGIITEAMRTHLGDRVVGICDTPIGLVRRVGRVLGVDVADAVVDYVGLNHLGWLRGLHVAGRDVLPGLLADDAALTRIEEARVLGVDWVRALGALPNEYLYYYYYAREATERITGATATRGEFLDAQQGGFYTAAAGARPTAAASAWERALHEREATYMAEARDDGEERDAEDVGGGYHEVAVDLMAALLGSEAHQMILDVANAGRITGLPADAVVEVPCAVDARGVQPLGPGTGDLAQPDAHMLGLMAQLKAAERAAIEAARAGSRSLAWTAFALHPLVDSVDLARRLVDDYVAASDLMAAALPHP